MYHMKLILRSAEASDVLDDNLVPQMDITFGIKKVLKIFFVCKKWPDHFLQILHLQSFRILCGEVKKGWKASFVVFHCWTWRQALKSIFHVSHGTATSTYKSIYIYPIKSSTISLEARRSLSLGKNASPQRFIEYCQQLLAGLMAEVPNGGINKN